MKIKVLKRAAFTLVEILVAIVILGLVAVMSIPEMVDDIRERTFSTASQVFLSHLQDAGNQMTSLDELTGYSTNEQFADAFTRYVKTTKRCSVVNLNQCFVPTFRTAGDEIITTASDLKTSADLKMFNNNNTLVGFALPTGTNIIMAYDPNCTMNDADKYNMSTPKTNCMSILYDVNASTGPNKMGKDILTLNATISTCDGAKIDGLCVAAGDTTYPSINTCTDTTWDSYGASNPSCATNYWAGAKKACADQDMRLPTLTEFDTIYTNKASVSGLNSTITYWSADDYDSSTARGQDFNTGGQGSFGKGNVYNARCVK